MNHAFVAIVALIAAAGTATAGAEAHFEIAAQGETHTLDILVSDDGAAVILVDGEPVAPGGLPETPDVPEEAPPVPEVPSVPTVPGLPPLPTLP